MHNRLPTRALVALPLVLCAHFAAAENQLSAPQAVALRTSVSIDARPAAEESPLILSAPPRDTADEGVKRFGPVAEYLSATLGRKVVYQHPTTWGGYQADMQRGAYDIVFDGPHFNGWRIEKLHHHVLVKLPGDFVYTAVVRRDHSAIDHIKHLAGHKICAHAPPNLGTLIMYNQFDNPARQPVIIVTDGYDKIYKALLDGKCDAAMLPLHSVEKFDPDGGHVRIVMRTRAMPEQAFSAGLRVSPAERAKIAEALLSPAAKATLAKFFEAYGAGKGFLPATNSEYAGLGEYLLSVWGYY
jgi:ABC-type phosphate/phosphonate transport system substrate-binding protein